MIKRNKTINWLKKNSENVRKDIMKNARKRAKETKLKQKKLEQNVRMQRQEVLRQIKLNKDRKKRRLN